MRHMGIAPYHDCEAIQISSPTDAIVPIVSPAVVSFRRDNPYHAKKLARTSPNAASRVDFHSSKVLGSLDMFTPSCCRAHNNSVFGTTCKQNSVKPQMLLTTPTSQPKLLVPFTKAHLVRFRGLINALMA